MKFNKKKVFNHIETMLVTGQYMNSFYNPSTANNGGGYWQYGGTAYCPIVFKKKAIVGWLVYSFTDLSCGDFGSRIWKDVSLIDVNGTVLYHNEVAYGSFEGQERYGDEDDHISEIARRYRLNFYDVKAFLRSLNEKICSEAYLKWDADHDYN